MATSSQTENILGLSKKDLSLIRHSLEAGGKLIHQVINGLKHGTSEVQQLILQQSDVILECRVCRNLFRSLPNYLDHKRIYCQELFPNESVSLLASPFADEVPIIYPEPPDDAKEFVEMSDLISKLNSKRNSERHVEMTAPLCKNKAHVQNPSDSIGEILEQSRHKRKLQPLYLQPIQGTSVAMKLVPLNTNKTTENKNLMELASKKREEATNTSCEKKSSATKASPPRNVNLRLLKMANFHKLLCLKCNQRYTTKYRLVSHINKFHLKVKLHKHKENGRNVDNNETKAGSNKISKQTKKETTQNNKIDVFSTKSGHPSLKKISYLAKTSNMAIYSEMKKGWCHICHQSYSGKRGLVFHMFRMHSGIRKIYPCLFCKVKSPSFASALRHTQTVHNCKKSEMKKVVKKLKASGHVENQQWQSLLEPKISVEKCDTQITKFLQGNQATPQLNLKTRPVSDQAKNDTSLTASQQKSGFRCQICHQIFSGNRGLRHHITRMHSIKQKPPENPYSCRICFMEFFTSFSLNRHYRLKHNLQENIQENKPKMERKVEATIHKKETPDSHLDENGFDKKSDSVLDNCLFHNNRKYKIPLKYYKTVSKYAHFPSLCLNCNQKFSGARNLIRHIIRMHCTYKNAFPCPFCHLSFISSVSILRHTKVQHSCSDQEIADLNQKLQVWEQQKRNNLDLKIRKKNVSNSSTVSDSSSEVESNANAVSFQEPSSIHDVTNFQTAKCLHCNQKLSGMQDLITHINKTHTAISNQTHQCFQCNETFESVFTIVEHMEKIHNIFLKQKRLNPQRMTMNKLLETDTSSTKVSLSIDEETSEENCKLGKTHGEDAQNSKLVMQCADFLRSRCLKCQEIFNGKRGLIAHIYKKHGYYGQTYSCYLCLKTFTSFALACQHTRSSHIYKGSAMTYVRVNHLKEEATEK